jgi:voltage-gated potassium channel
VSTGSVNSKSFDVRMPRWWDALVVIVTLLSLSVLVVDGITDEHSPLVETLHWADLVCCSVLIADFGWRLKKAPSRWDFIRRNWIDLLASIPTVGVLRAGRLVRLARIIRMVRLAVLLKRFLARADVPLPSAALGYLGAVAILVWVAAAGGFYLFEHGRNPSVVHAEDALWWSMTTLSTVGYGDLYPMTMGGRVVAGLTMALGVGVLGTFAGTVATVFVELRDIGRRGLRRYEMEGHALILGWNRKGPAAVDFVLAVSDISEAGVVVVADLETSPIEKQGVRFVRGNPTRAETLQRASGRSASMAVVLANDPLDPRSDHESVLAVLALRRINPRIRISVELVEASNREHLEPAGCDAIVDPASFAAGLLVRGARDAGIERLLATLLSDDEGAHIARLPAGSEYGGRVYREFARAMFERGMCALGVLRKGRVIVNPASDFMIEAGDEAFVVREHDSKSN